MDEPFFPLKAEQVVPILKIEDNDYVTRVQTRKTERLTAGLKLQIVRVIFGSIFKITVVKIDSQNPK
jgi:hypothetical protein